MFKRALICTDFEDGLNRLVKFVPSLAAGGFKQIIFFHSVPLWDEGAIPREDTAKITEAKKRLNDALTEVPAGVEVIIEVVSGTPLDTIKRILKTYQIDLILIGTPIRSSLQERIVGSTSVGLAKLTDVPIMVLRPQLISTYTEEELALRCQHLCRELLIPYNDSSIDRYLIQRIKEFATDRPANSLQSCKLMWVVEESRVKKEIVSYLVDEAQKKLAAVKKELEQLNLQVDIEVRQGNSLTEIIKAATYFDISAIAIASEHKNDLLELTVPDFAEELLHKSWFPLLFFSPRK